uniref:Adaptor-related protein complex AP-1, sigma 3 n=1 Tax=Mus spicilegus TaxID=10103 RepID=A0A8C6HF85_MUSSI
IHFILLFSRQGKLRLQKWYTTLPDKERKKITRDIIQTVLSRGHRTSSFIDWKELKLVYKSLCLPRMLSFLCRCYSNPRLLPRLASGL